MSRTVNLTLPPDKLEKILPKIKEIEGFIALRIEKDVAVDPPGTIASFEITNDSASRLMLLLKNEGLLGQEDLYITMARPVSVLYKPAAAKVKGEGSESTWEEVQTDINETSNMKLNGLGNMFLSGLIAALGISTNAIHVVIGAMVIAPGFEPISRISLGLVTDSTDWSEGLKDTLKGYLLLIIGAMCGALLISWFGKEIFPTSSSYLSAGSLVKYWTSITSNSIAVSVAAALAGGLIMMTNKGVLTAGVMIALALIPTASLMGMAIAEGDMNILLQSSTRFGIDVLIVFFFTALVFLWKRFMKHHRKMES